MIIQVHTMANIKNNSASQETQKRLLLAAGEVFAERGYHAATIKEITDAAGASLASVNYHFRDKAELYAAVLRKIADDRADIIPPDEALTGSPANRLRQFIAWYCDKAMCRDRQPWEQMLLAREMVEPTPALDVLFDAVFKPLNYKLSGLLAELLNVPTSSDQVALASASVLGQCTYYLKHYPMIGRMHPQLGDKPDVSTLSAHIAKFTLAGLKVHVKSEVRSKRRRAVVG
jgi:TetR/AcrR family transcriptional regulator, regulator of cefoperazone and chloramphenicol sensitivity